MEEYKLFVRFGGVTEVAGVDLDRIFPLEGTAVNIFNELARLIYIYHDDIEFLTAEEMERLETEAGREL